MKIRPVILCGGSGTRLWNNVKNFQAKQFIDFGGWNLFRKTLKRINNKHFDSPIISTNKKYLLDIKKNLKKEGIRKYNIILEPIKRNTGPAILSSILLKNIPFDQPIIFLPSDHLIEKNSSLIRILNKKIQFLEDKIVLFGIKPTYPSSQYGYICTKKGENNLYKVSRFIEKPNVNKAKKIINKNTFWNAGIFLSKKKTIIKNFKKYNPKIYENSLKSIYFGKQKKNIFYLNKKFYSRNKSESFDISILEKCNNIFALKLVLPWSDLGSWSEIIKIFSKNKANYYNKKNVFKKPWGKYINIFKGKNFLIKELNINSKSSLSLQKHFHRSEYWTVTQGKPKITLNKKIFFKKKGENIFIKLGSIHRVENNFIKPVKIMEVQTGSILKESDIVRYKDIYGRIK